MVNGTVTERFIYKDQLAPIAKLDAEGNVLEEYVYGTGINSPDYIRKDGINYRVIKDHLGSVRMIDNASTGEVVKTLRYSEYGEITEETGAFETIFGFAGGLQDRDTGLIHFGARWYDPETGRWISKEPLGFEGSNNFYSYVNGDPVNKIDPSGLKLILLGDAADKAFITIGLAKLEKYSPTAKELIFHLEFSDKNVIIQMANLNDNDPYNDDNRHEDGFVTWQRNINVTEPWEMDIPSEIWLAHELIHALHYIHKTDKPPLNGAYSWEKNQPEEYFTTGLDGSLYPFTENRIRKDYMKYYPELTFRDYYFGGGLEYETKEYHPKVAY